MNNSRSAAGWQPESLSGVKCAPPHLAISRQAIERLQNVIQTGNEEEMMCKERKAFWNSSLHNLEIISYSRVLRRAKQELAYRGGETGTIQSSF